MNDEEMEKNEALEIIDQTVTRSKELIKDLQAFARPKKPRKLRDG